MSALPAIEESYDITGGPHGSVPQEFEVGRDVEMAASIERQRIKEQEPRSLADLFRAQGAPVDPMQARTTTPSSFEKEKELERRPPSRPPSRTPSKTPSSILERRMTPEVLLGPRAMPPGSFERENEQERRNSSRTPSSQGERRNPPEIPLGTRTETPGSPEREKEQERRPLSTQFEARRTTEDAVMPGTASSVIRNTEPRRFRYVG